MNSRAAGVAVSMVYAAFDLPDFHLIAAGQTDVGRTRSRNEDGFDLDEAAEFAVVCDGMGGHAGGDIASRTAVEAVAGALRDFMPAARAASDRPPAPADDHDCTLSEPAGGTSVLHEAVSAVRAAVQEANQRIHRQNRERGYADGRGMGTTLVGYWRVPGTAKLVAFHAGDSRLYRLRDGELLALTRDHSLYQMWLDNGGTGVAPQRNIIVRALGTGGAVEPDICLYSLMPGDVYLLCSDGLNGLVPDAMITRILAREPQPRAACAALVDAANAAGGLDNITVVVARLVPRA
ncbi:PP2C family protein-serine/threonine phosphatase [Azospirillum thermophilum]|nr:protein phosphatase 2C domain-containing protein [Azospirillum thermophilum]